MNGSISHMNGITDKVMEEKIVVLDAGAQYGKVRCKLRYKILY